MRRVGWPLLVAMLASLQSSAGSPAERRLMVHYNWTTDGDVLLQAQVLAPAGKLAQAETLRLVLPKGALQKELPSGVAQDLVSRPLPASSFAPVPASEPSSTLALIAVPADRVSLIEVRLEGEAGSATGAELELVRIDPRAPRNRIMLLRERDPQAPPAVLPPTGFAPADGGRR